MGDGPGRPAPRPMSAALTLAPGAEVLSGGQRYVITHVPDLTSVLAKHPDTGERVRLPVRSLAPAPQPGADAPSGADVDLEAVTDEDWTEANRRFEAIRPLLGRRRTQAEVQERAKAARAHWTTLYAWIRAYNATGKVSALLPRKSMGGRGKSRLDPAVETILQETIEDYYLRSQKPSVQKTIEEVKRRLRNARLPAPHPNTVRNRIARLSDERRLARREGRKHAEQRFARIRGAVPGAEAPLALVQIDHTKLDVIVVDDEHRRPVGRPWVTLAMDVFSRTVLGLYVSLDPPSTLSVGMCLVHAILPKERWLADREVEAEWPCWGMPRIVHADNAKEFHGDMLARAADEYQFELRWRPKGQPHFGGHVERLLGTFTNDLHTLPGTTFSNPGQRGDYDSEGRAALTVRELERWLATLVTKVYHARIHSSLGTTPLKRWEEGVFGTGGQLGTGVPARFTDEERLTLDFLPSVERTVQRYGVVIDGVRYWSEALSRWIHAKDPAVPQRKRKFRFRRDPRDISVIYFYDPDVLQYYAIPYGDASHPRMSIWELREARRLAKERRGEHVDEAAIFDAYEELRHQEKTAVKTTKRVRRRRQRRREHRASVRPLAPTAEAVPESTRSTHDPGAAPVKAFAEIDEFEEEER